MFSFDNLDDPKKQMLLAMAAGLLSPVRSKGMSGFGEAMGQGINAGLMGYNAASQNKRRNELSDIQKKMSQMQIGEMERGQQFNQALSAGYQPSVNPLTPNDDQGNPMPRQSEGFDFSQAMQVDPVKAMQMKAQLAPPKPKMAFAPNGQAVDMNALQPGTNYAPTPAPEKPPELIRYQKLADDPNQPESVRKIAQAYIAKATSHAPAANVTTNVMPPREIFKDSMTLKKDFDGVPEVKGFKEVRGAWDQIATALSKPSAANDMAAATKFMKLLDPGSVVRESELMMAMQASGVLDRMANYHKRLMSGEKLTPTQREDFYNSGKALYEAAKSRYDETVTQYEGIAKQYGLDPAFIYRGKERLNKNTTATVKAREAIKAGAPRDQVIKRLIEEGYDPEGL